MVTEWIEDRWARVALIFALLLGVGGLGGCAAALPVVGDAATTAVNATVALFEAGQVVTYEPVSMEEATAAVGRMQLNLDLTETEEQTIPYQVKMRYRDQRDQEILVTLVQRTRRVTAVYVNVGLFGKMGMAELVMHQIQRQLAVPTTKPSRP